MGRLALRPGLRAYAHAPAGVEEAYANQYSFLFGGTDEYLGIGAETIVPGAYSISLWAKASGTGANQYLINMGAHSGSATYFLSRVFVNKMTNNLRYAESTGLGADWTGFVSGTFLNADHQNWHHVVLTSTGVTAASGVVDLWANGSKIITGGAGKEWAGPSDTETLVGALKVGTAASNPYAGNIDEVSIYDRVISDADVATLYNGGGPTVDATSVSGCIHYWRMGDGDGDDPEGTVYDQVGDVDLDAQNMEAADKEEDVPA